MAQFVKVARVSDIPLHFGKVLKAGEELVAVFNVNGTFYAIDNSCPHRGGYLGEGDLNGTVVTCPLHAWRYDVVSGLSPDIPDEKVKTYPCKVEGEDILVEIVIANDQRE